MRACIVTATGWTLDMIDALPFPDVLALFKYWDECPPPHLLLKAFVGYKKEKQRRGELNRHERDALPSPGAVLPTLQVPAYVMAAMKDHPAEELSRAGY